MKPVYVFDTEVYSNYFLSSFKSVDTGELVEFEMTPDFRPDFSPMWKLMKDSIVVTFNGINFDMPLVALLMQGADCELLKAGANAIIEGNLRPWHFERKFGVKIPTRVDHIDLIEVAPGVASLKIYGGRLHARRLQDLPIEPDATITPAQRPILRSYCGNDLDTTIGLYNALLAQIALRTEMGKTYGLDLRSKSDAQIAEAVICKSAATLLGGEVKRPSVKAGTTFRYTAPGFLKFTTPQLQGVADLVAGLDFVVPATGAVLMPKELKALKIKIGGSTYQMGIGGLHSTEKSVATIAGPDSVLVDRDVASYYPAIILNTGLAPAHMGGAFTKTFRAILAKRLEAKRAGNKVIADSLKICVNGSFGKLGSKWSKLYAPNLMIQTTVTGQLSLLMLIEALEAAGIPIVSANTDGVVAACPKARMAVMDGIVNAWETATGFETEATEYRALYARDINNYIALKKDGGVKLKGVFAPVGLQKNPANEICTGAVVKFLMDGTPVEDSIRGCQDVRKFVTVRQVKGGAVHGGDYLGKAVRWYYSIAGYGPIIYRSNGNAVARSDGAIPLMELPDAVPADIDYDWYITEAKSILEEIGA